MQLGKVEVHQLYRLLEVTLREAMWDYSYCSDISVVNINGQPLIFNKEQLNILGNLQERLEKEINHE